MDFFNRDLYEKGLELQKSLTEQYMNGLKQYSGLFGTGGSDKDSGDGTFADAQKAMFDAFNNMFAENVKKAGDFAGEAFNSYFDAAKKWQDAFTSPDTFNIPDFLSFMLKFNSSMDVYNKLFEFWKNLTDIDPDTAGNPAELYNKYMEMSGKFIKNIGMDFTKAWSMEDFTSTYSAWGNLAKTMTESAGVFLEPWTKRQSELYNAYLKAISGDNTGVNEYLDLLTAAYKDSFSKIFQTNGVGLNKDMLGITLKFTDSFIRVMLSGFDISARVTGVMTDAGQELYKKIAETITDTDKSLTFKDFYDMWIRVNADAVNKFYNTDEFAAFLNEYSNNAYDLKANFNKLFESMMAYVPVPTDSELKSVYKTVYDLRKDVRSLKKEITALKKELANLKDTEE